MNKAATDLFHHMDSVRIIVGRMPKSHARDEAMAHAERAVELYAQARSTEPAAIAIKAAYFEGFVAAAGGYAGEQTAKQYAEKNWPYSQAEADATALSKGA